MSDTAPDDVYSSTFVHPSSLPGWVAHVPTVATPAHLAPATPEPVAAPVADEGEHHGE